MGTPKTGKGRYYTKSRYKMSCECPTKTYYAANPEYENKLLNDSFLEALAYGGFQVGALAKVYHPEGHDITALDYETALAQTNELLKMDEVTIFEAAIKYEHWFIRVDILKKQGDHFQLIEVKSKSYHPRLDDQFYNKASLKKGKPKLLSKWEPYLQDIAFQALVTKKAFPDAVISPYMMFANKDSVTTVEGLNQRFLLTRKDGKQEIIMPPDTSLKSVGESILVSVKVDAEVSLLHESKDKDGRSFEERATYFAEHHVQKKKLPPIIGKQCKTCEFRVGRDELSEGLKSGFEECWVSSTKLSKPQLAQPLVFDIWNYRKTDKCLKDETYLVSDLSEEDIAPKPDNEPKGLSNSERQWEQVSRVINKDNSPYFDMEGLASEMQKWQYPLHFIDFETTMAAIPFNKGRRPYEQIAFQFSHHVVHKNGTIRHQGEYFNSERGSFPNFDFLRALRVELEQDKGTIFRYAAHENTVLCQIYEQLLQSEEHDSEELCEWIRSITKSGSSNKSEWLGPRNMVDMCELVKRYYYHPSTSGSNSIKKVLPAILNDSEYLRHKYSKPVYGNSLFPSLNFSNFTWYELEAEGTARDPYKLLPPVFGGVPNEQLDNFLCDDELADGGAAMIAYAMMQFSQVKEEEFTNIRAALLRYCELDTLAMVMIWEYWRESLERASLVDHSLLKKAV